MTSVDRVKAICKERKIPIYKLESDLDFSNGYISGLKKGRLPDDRLAKVAKYLKVDVSFLLGENDEKNPATSGDGLIDKDTRLLMWFRSLPPEKQKAILISQDAPEDLL